MSGVWVKIVHGGDNTYRNMASIELQESRVREIVQEEMFLHVMMQEGIWDDVVDGVQKLKAAATKKFGSAAGPWAKSLKQTLAEIGKRPGEVDDMIKVIMSAMKESGESIRMDSTLTAAKQVGQVSPQEALAMAQADLAGPVHDKAEKASQSAKSEALYLGGMYEILLERECLIQKRRQLQPLNEVGIIGAVGLGMATLGGSLMLFRGLAKLAGWLGAEKLQNFFSKITHALHKVEHKAIDIAIPDRLAHIVYTFLFKRKLRIAGPKMLSLKEFRSDATGKHAMAVTKGLIYKVLLIYFAWNGIEGAIKAGASMLGFVEGAASTVKGVEIASGAGELAAIAAASSDLIEI